jgi:hypothetical protein
MTMRRRKMLRSRDLVIARVQFSDSIEVKQRQAVVLFLEFGNIVVAV